MVFKTTVSFLRLTNFKQFRKRCSVARGIQKLLNKKIQEIIDISGYDALFSKPVKTHEPWDQDGCCSCYVSELKKYGCSKVGLNSLILLDIDNILSNIVRDLLIVSYIV